MNDIQRLERIYGVAGRELRSWLLALEPLSYTDGKGQAVMAKARELVKVLNYAVGEWATEAIPRAYAKGERTARTALEILGKRPRRPPFVDKRVKLIDDTMLILIRANNSIPASAQRFISATAQASRSVRGARVQEFSFGEASEDIGRLAAEAELKEKSRGWLSREVRDYLRGLIEDDEFIEINGRMYRMRKYAELVGRTVMRESQTEATLDLCREYENDLVVISDHGCDCDICEPYEGNTYSISGRSLRYPMLEDSPPFHPNCKHALHATSEEAIEVRSARPGGGESELRRTIREAEEAAQWRNIR